MTETRVVRVGLGFLAVVSIQVGVWAQLAPRSFYDHFPGLGRVWISVDGAYNEHLVRDVGGLNLALAVVLVAAAITLSRPLIVAAALASLAYGVPHLLYHSLHTEQFGAVDVAGIIGGLALFAVVPVALLAASMRPSSSIGSEDR